jgi:hypothetical protein
MVRRVRRGLASPMTPNSCGGARRCVRFPTRNLVALVYSLVRGKEGKVGGGGGFNRLSVVTNWAGINGIKEGSNRQGGSVTGVKIGWR